MVQFVDQQYWTIIPRIFLACPTEIIQNILTKNTNCFFFVICELVSSLLIVRFWFTTDFITLLSLVSWFLNFASLLHLYWQFLHRYILLFRVYKQVSFPIMIMLLIKTTHWSNSCTFDWGSILPCIFSRWIYCWSNWMGHRLEKV